MGDILIPVLLILVGLAVLKCPIYISILCSALYLQVVVNNMGLTNLFTGMFEAMTKNSLLAMPFFMVAGSFIAASSLGNRLINVFVEMLKTVRGGLPIACVLSNAIFGAISGSGPAATATFGKVVHEPLSKRHGEQMSLGIITSSAALSNIIPPSVSMIIFGIATETSITKLFIAGILPGILIVIILSIYLIIRCKPAADGVKETFSKSDFGQALWKGLPVLVLPVVVLGSIYTGICTPTESGAIAAAYAIIVAVFGTKDIKPSKILGVFCDAGRTTAQIFLLICTSTVFSQAATIAQIPAAITEAFGGMGQIQFLLMLNVLLLIVGCFFDVGAAILILAPMLMPTAVALGIPPLHFGMIFVVNLAIGLFTPPFGMNIFVAQSVLHRPLGVISRACAPYIVLYIIGLLVITYVPALSTFLPALIG